MPPPLQNTPPFFQRLIGNSPPTTSHCETLRDHINRQQLLSCSDGAYCPTTNNGSHSWIFGSSDTPCIVAGAGPDDGHPTSMSSYRTELGGIVATLYIIYRICEYYEITTGEAKLYCDNKGALAHSFKPITPGLSPFLSPSYNLVLLAKQLVSRIPITIIGEWVKGHYTGKDRNPQHDLNDKADQIAGEHLATQDGQDRTNACLFPCPGYKIRLIKDGQILSSAYRKVIAQGHHEQQLQEYILKRTKWSWVEFHKVNWEAHGRAFRRLTRHQQILTAKLIHNLANTNRQNFLYYQQSPLCPGCQDTEETMELVLHCHCPQTEECRQQQLRELQTTLTNLNTPPPVLQAIMKGFQDWITPSPVRSQAPTYGSLRGPGVILTSAYYEQFHQLGWFQLCLGRLSKRWSNALSAYYANTSPNFDSEQWVTSFISTL
jgi:hypothetical protein